MAQPPSVPNGAQPKGRLTVDSLTALLVRRGVLTDVQRKDIMVKTASLRARLIKEKLASFRDRRRFRYEPHPAEIVVAADYQHPQDKQRKLDEEVIFKAVAAEAGLAYLKVDPLKLNPAIVTSVFSRPFARRHVIIPLEVTEQKIKIAIADPFDTELLESIKRITARELEIAVSSREDIVRIILEFHGFKHSVTAAEKIYGAKVDLGNLEQYVKLKAVEEIEATDRHIVNAVEYLLHYAFEQRASDIHIEPKREYSVIRLRIDGILHTVHSMPRSIHPAMISRIKMLARLDIAEKRKPQDGRIKTAKGNTEVELRISTLATAFGEKVVIRIFDPQVLIQELDELGFYPREQQLYEEFLGHPNGLILVTGPTGSGKTTTLYSSLRMLAGPEINITTIEDPIEMVYEELNQTAVNPKIGITFAESLRHILRQDPDVIMVGEIRDPETAENAIQAALTGHLVLSTLHTQDSAGALTRMIELKVKPFLLSSTMIGIVAQRLTRRICPHCVIDTFLTPEQVAALEINIPEGENRQLPVRVGLGCVTCRGTGYYSRTGLFEVLPITDKIRKLITEDTDVVEVMKVARLDGMMTLREAAVKKLAHGVTTFDEVVRVTGDF